MNLAPESHAHPDPPDDLIAGTVTFLFADIEGSTRLLEQLGDRYADLLATHRGLLRAAFRAEDGRTVTRRLTLAQRRQQHREVHL